MTAADPKESETYMALWTGLAIKAQLSATDAGTIRESRCLTEMFRRHGRRQGFGPRGRIGRHGAGPCPGRRRALRGLFENRPADKLFFMDNVFFLPLSRL
jgi:hypothetical protein